MSMRSAGVTVSLAVLAAQNTIGAGTDTLSGFENLTGSAFNDTLTGDANTNVLIGLAGNDILNGGAGADLMLGGSGNDTYVVDNVGDVVDETGGDGIDTVQSSVSFSLADPVHAIGAIENLTLTGSAVINGTGNDLDNVLIGNAANNVLIGLGGNDTLNGGGRCRSSCWAGRATTPTWSTTRATWSTRRAATASTRCSRRSASALPTRCTPSAPSRT